MSAGMDITPLVAPDSQVINGYFGGGFRVAGVRYQGAMIIHPDRSAAWSGEITIEAFAEALSDDVEVLIIGTGSTFELVQPALRIALRQRGIGVEAMTTPAACRTFNVLLTEGRKVAAAMLPMPEDAG